MVNTGILTRFEAQLGREAAIEHALSAALVSAQAEPTTSVWCAFRLGPASFGSFAAFPAVEARHAHRLDATLPISALAQSYSIQTLDILAAKLPLVAPPVTVGFLNRLVVKPEHAADAERAITQTLPNIEAEADTIAWFAFRLGPATFGVFDVFPDEAGRQAHRNNFTAGRAERIAALLAEPFRMEQVDVLAAWLPGMQAAP